MSFLLSLKLPALPEMISLFERASAIREDTDYFGAANARLKELRDAHYAMTIARRDIPQNLDYIYELSDSQLDAVIVQLLALERQFVSLRADYSTKARRTISSGASRGFARQTLSRRIAIALDRAMVDTLLYFRDLRFEAMAILAERQPASDSRELSDVANIRSYFGQLDAA